MKHNFKIENIKCGGCANTITKKLKEINEVEDVEVKVEEQQVIVKTETTCNTDIHDLISDKLTKLGYSEAGKNGSNNLMIKATSVVSCTIGKVTNKSYTGNTNN